jgi:hypothetical protein
LASGLVRTDGLFEAELDHLGMACRATAIARTDPAAAAHDRPRMVSLTQRLPACSVRC